MFPVTCTSVGKSDFSVVKHQKTGSSGILSRLADRKENWENRAEHEPLKIFSLNCFYLPFCGHLY